MIMVVKLAFNKKRNNPRRMKPQESPSGQKYAHSSPPPNPSSSHRFFFEKKLKFFEVVSISHLIHMEDILSRPTILDKIKFSILDLNGIFLINTYLYETK